ncbi:uncharacterized protein AB675_2960 [Cyphellophora attinorum]|uniref:Uncharacterized protein n=1 Tax=Cyphellophora attinorum TaxID=1664694 RepID=A0A0N1GZH1_9EURO|nr:uncharacterized protein AB675_2960 [Phialophora attinorum]KPI36470.1 hypothetical protein AB675_2960 [Phialophora attinorum]
MNQPQGSGYAGSSNNPQQWPIQPLNAQQAQIPALGVAPQQMPHPNLQQWQTPSSYSQPPPTMGGGLASEQMPHPYPQQLQTQYPPYLQPLPTMGGAFASQQVPQSQFPQQLQPQWQTQPPPYPQPPPAMGGGGFVAPQIQQPPQPPQCQTQPQIPWQPYLSQETQVEQSIYPTTQPATGASLELTYTQTNISRLAAGHRNPSMNQPPSYSAYGPQVQHPQHQYPTQQQYAQQHAPAAQQPYSAPTMPHQPRTQQQLPTAPPPQLLPAPQPTQQPTQPPQSQEVHPVQTQASDELPSPTPQNDSPALTVQTQPFQVMLSADESGTMSPNIPLPEPCFEEIQEPSSRTWSSVVERGQAMHNRQRECREQARPSPAPPRQLSPPPAPARRQDDVLDAQRGRRVVVNGRGAVQSTNIAAARPTAVSARPERLLSELDASMSALTLERDSRSFVQVPINNARPRGKGNGKTKNGRNRLQPFVPDRPPDPPPGLS